MTVLAKEKAATIAGRGLHGLELTGFGRSADTPRPLIRKF